MTSRDFDERARHVKTRELTILRHYLRTRVVTESEVVAHFVSNRNIRTNDAAHTPLQKKKTITVMHSILRRKFRTCSIDAILE